MTLNETQIALLSELVGESYEATSSALSGVLAGLSDGERAAVETQLSSILTTYTPIKDKHLRMHGGRSGIDIDYDRNRAKLRRSARVLLGMDSTSSMPTFFALVGGGRGY